MAKQFEKANTKFAEISKFASLKNYTLKERFSICVGEYIISTIIFLIGKTLRFEEVEGYESPEKASEKQPPEILAFWHNYTFLTAYFWRKCKLAIMISQSFDGEYTTRVAQRFGYGVARGSSKRDGLKALKKMIEIGKEGIGMSITVDGPRGPRHKVQKGIIHLAKHSNLPIRATLAQAENFWTISSWDKLQIPKPFTKARIFVAEPVYVSEDANKEEVLNKQKELQRKLDELVEIGKQWRDSKN